MADVASEDGLKHAQGDVGPDVEEGSAELLDRHRFHVPTHRQGGPSGGPGLVVRPHRIKQLFKFVLLEASKVFRIVHIPVSHNEKKELILL